MGSAQRFSVPISFIPFEDRFLARMSGLSVGTYGSTTTGQTCSRLRIVSGFRLDHSWRGLSLICKELLGF
jgi:hypothetical protein